MLLIYCYAYAFNFVKQELTCPVLNQHCLQKMRKNIDSPTIQLTYTALEFTLYSYVLDWDTSVKRRNKSSQIPQHPQIVKFYQKPRKFSPIFRCFPAFWMAEVSRLYGLRSIEMSCNHEHSDPACCRHLDHRDICQASFSTLQAHYFVYRGHLVWSIAY